jgi:hypothetical protein
MARVMTIGLKQKRIWSPNTGHAGNKYSDHAGSEVPGFRSSEVLKSRVPRFLVGRSRELRNLDLENLGTSEPIRYSEPALHLSVPLFLS